MRYRRGLALLLCGLLLTAGVSLGVAVHDAQRSQPESMQSSVDLPSTLEINQTRAEFTGAQLTVTSALSMGYQTLQQNFTQLSVQVRLEEATTETDRKEVLSNATEELEGSVTKLARVAAHARSQYRAEEITAKQYGMQLAEIHRQANALLGTAEQIEAAAEDQPDIRTQVVELRANLQMYTGPVRAQIADTLSTDDPLDRIYISAGPDGTALAIIDGDTYLRETNSPDHYDSEPGQIPDAGPLLENIKQKYPWVMNQSAGVSYQPLPIDAQLPRFAYALTLRYTQGTVNAYIDSSTQNIYREVQRLQLDDLTHTPDTTITHDGYRVNISRSYNGGPLHIETTTTDGVPVQAQIEVTNRTIKTTNDGTEWILAETNDTITVTTGDTEIQIDQL